MSISKKIRKKKVTKKAPLSFLDAAVYFILLLIFIFICFAPMILFVFVLPERYALANEAIIAFNNGNQWELLLCFPFSFALILSLAIPFAHLGIGSRPIFGNPHYKPKAREAIIHQDPLVSKAFWRNLSHDTIEDIKKSSIGCLIALVITAPLLQLCIYPREVIEKNDYLITYNLFNQVSHSAQVGEAEQLKIDIYKYDGGRHRTTSHYGIEISVLYEDTSYSFTLGDFKNMSTEETLQYMLHIKSYFSKDKYEITHVDRMDKLIDDNDFSTQEIELIYELFDYR